MSGGVPYLVAAYLIVFLTLSLYAGALRRQRGARRAGIAGHRAG